MLRSAFSVLCVLLLTLSGMVGCGGGTTVAENDSSSADNNSVKPALDEADFRVVVDDEPIEHDKPSYQNKWISGESSEETGTGEEASGVQVDPVDSVNSSPKPDNLVKADVDATGKGQGYGNDPITAPVRALARTQERVKFIELESNLKIHRAINGDIKSMDEFMQFVRENGLRLPELPEGDKYFWDADNQELMVEAGGR